MRWTLVVALLAVAHGAAAEGEDDRQIAKRLFTAGRKLAEQNNYIEACVLFEKSYQLDPAVGTRLNLADCAEKQGKPRAAWLLWVSAADEFDRAGDDRATFARKRADALAAKLATIEVHLARPQTKGLTLKIGVREVSPAATVIERLDEGSVTITASAPARQPVTRTVEVGIGQKVVIDIPKLARLVPNEPDDEEPPASSHGPWMSLAIVGGIVTVGSFGFATYAAIRTNQLEQDFRDSGNDPLIEHDGEIMAKRANIALVIGAASAVATSLFVYKAVRSRRANHATAGLVVPVITPQLAGASLQLRW